MRVYRLDCPFYDYVLTPNQAEELSQSLRSRILELDQHSHWAGTAIQQTVDTLFRSDDKLLSSLQKLGWELETGDDGEQQDVALLRETCARSVFLFVALRQDTHTGAG